VGCSGSAFVAVISLMPRIVVPTSSKAMHQRKKGCCKDKGQPLRGFESTGQSEIQSWDGRDLNSSISGLDRPAAPDTESLTRYIFL
jgi:hypothetical protein